MKWKRTTSLSGNGYSYIQECGELQVRVEPSNLLRPGQSSWSVLARAHSGLRYSEIACKSTRALAIKSAEHYLISIAEGVMRVLLSKERARADKKEAIAKKRKNHEQTITQRSGKKRKEDSPCKNF